MSGWGASRGTAEFVDEHVGPGSVPELADTTAVGLLEARPRELLEAPRAFDERLKEHASASLVAAGLGTVEGLATGTAAEAPEHGALASARRANAPRDTANELRTTAETP